MSDSQRPKFRSIKVPDDLMDLVTEFHAQRLYFEEEIERLQALYIQAQQNMTSEFIAVGIIEPNDPYFLDTRYAPEHRLAFIRIPVMDNEPPKKVTLN